MENREIESVYLSICGNLADNVRLMNALISDEKIEPALKVKMIATSITALTEVKDTYQEMLDVLNSKGSDTSISE
ncbi:MAG: hypothetical protein NC084_09790 [Bacteroides sp.]|nr:hypothetical protein [Eubacterium sp.]MCM1419424.1 hypothetical protein [Roseburia sp.]MCM1462989.1 hypothetical protein [Bacteroides sp.]